MSTNGTLEVQHCRVSRWTYVDFPDAIKDVTGGNPKLKSSDYLAEGGFPIIDQGASYIGGYTNNQSDLCRAKLPCIVFGDHTKAFKFVEEPFALGADGIKVLQPVNDLDARFAFHFLRHVGLPSSAGYSRHFKFLKQHQIPLPKLEEQKRIAAILDKADAIRRQRQEAINTTAELVDSLFYQSFGDPLSQDQEWDVKEVGDVADIIVPTRDKPKSFTGAIPWVTLPDIDGLFIGKSKLCLTKDEAGEVGTRLTPRGAVLLSCAGSLNVVAITERELYTNQQFYALIPRLEIVNPIYLAYSLKLRGEEFYKRLAGTVTISFFSKSKAQGISIPCPPLALQERFVDRLLTIHSLQARMKSQADEASDLFNSLVQRAFKGEL